MHCDIHVLRTDVIQHTTTYMYTLLTRHTRTHRAVVRNNNPELCCLYHPGSNRHTVHQNT